MRGKLSESALRRIVRVALMEVAGEKGAFRSALDKAGVETASEVYSGDDSAKFIGDDLKFVSKGGGKFDVVGYISGEKLLSFVQEGPRAKLQKEMETLRQGGQLDVQMTELLGVSLPGISLSLVKDSDSVDMQSYSILSVYGVDNVFDLLKDSASDTPGDESNKVFVAIRVGGDLVQEFPGGKTDPVDILSRVVTWIEGAGAKELPYKKGQKIWPFLRNTLKNALLELAKNRITIPDDPQTGNRAILANLSAFAKKKNVTGDLQDQVRALAEAIPVADEAAGTKSADFGPLTDLATRVFQAAVTYSTKEFNLVIDGLMGEETLKAMANVVGRGTTRGEPFNLPPTDKK